MASKTSEAPDINALLKVAQEKDRAAFEARETADRLRREATNAESLRYQAEIAANEAWNAVRQIGTKAA